MLELMIMGELVTFLKYVISSFALTSLYGTVELLKIEL